MKVLLLLLANLLAKVWRFIPARLRTGFITGLFVLDSRAPDSAVGLRRLLTLKDKLEWVINERALAYGKGEHPKHRLMRYHEFFIERIVNGQSVLDVGCGYGAVARSIACALPQSTVIGMDLSDPRLAQASAADNPSNLSFVKGDATHEVPSGSWDVLILSNVLEHISDRIVFLKGLQKTSRATCYLIREPMFERDWQMPLRREIGVNYYSCLLYTSPSPRDLSTSRMPSSA